MNDLKNAVERLYNQLEVLAVEHDELSDTDVREALHVTLNFYFVWGKPPDKLPINYAMFTASGDKAVAEVVNHFIRTACEIADRQGVGFGQPRLDVLQDESILTQEGNTFDLYIGQTDEPLAPVALWQGRFEPCEEE